MTRDEIIENAQIAQMEVTDLIRQIPESEEQQKALLKAEMLEVHIMRLTNLSSSIMQALFEEQDNSSWWRNVAKYVVRARQRRAKARGWRAREARTSSN